MEVRIKKLAEHAVVPSYAIDGDCGLDITATGFKWNDLAGFIEYNTSLSIEIPKGYAGFLFPRSSISKTSLAMSNSVGIIDSNYRGEIKIRFRINDHTNRYDIGDRIAQLVILPYPEISLVEVEELSETERGTGGFGSTGN